MKTRQAFFSLSLLTAFVFFQPAYGQDPAGGTARQPLWKIQGKQATVYLLGSVHFLKKENYPMAPAIEKAFEQAKVAVFESDLSQMEKPEIQMQLMGKSMLTGGQTLKDQISPKLYERLSAQLKESGVPIIAMQNFKPGMVAMTLAISELQKMGLDPQFGVDRHFHSRALKTGKKIVGLEPAEFQVDLITGLSKEEGEAILDSALKDVRSMREELGTLLKAWKAGDMKSVGDMLNKAMEDHPGLSKRMLTDRNKSWLPKIEELIRGDKDAIVIVGAGHLAGKDSVIELLTNNGAKVVQQ